MNDDWPDYSKPYVAWGPMWPFIVPWMQAMQAWTRAMSACIPAAMPAVPQDSWNPYATCGAKGSVQPSTASAPPPKVSVKVSSPYLTTEVSVCVDPGADAMCLTADPLIPIGDESDSPALTQVVVECEKGHVHFSVTVPDKQRPGRYSGAVRDAARCRRGELTVQISKPATAG